MDFLETSAAIFNEMALDPVIYPHQECPIVFLYPGEILAEKADEYACAAGMDLSNLGSWTALVVRDKHIIGNVAGDDGGIVSPDGIHTTYCVSTSIPNGSDLESTLRPAFLPYFTWIHNTLDEHSMEWHCMPRFGVVIIELLESVEDTVIFRTDARFICQRD
jgi:hypothetical protein